MQGVRGMVTQHICPPPQSWPLIGARDFLCGAALCCVASVGTTVSKPLATLPDKRVCKCGLHC